MEILSIIIDSREQAPWSFPSSHVAARIAKLEAGDYALEGDAAFAIERKSLDDFAGTISSGWERFGREIGRMSEHTTKVVIVEGRLLDLCFWEDAAGALHSPSHNHFRVNPQFVMTQVARLTMAGVSVLFAENAEIAAALAYAVLRERANQIKGVKPWQ